MDYFTKIGSSTLSDLFAIFYSSEEHMFRNQQNGMFLGQSEKYSIPFLFDQGPLLNQHIFVSGATGSGKSYFLKSLVIKNTLLSDSKIIIIDITGEYENISNSLFASNENLQTFILGDNGSKVIYYNLSSLTCEDKKIKKASALLSEIVEIMRRRGINKNSKILLVFDEAWKLLAKNALLETLIREGRKYGFGIVIASQMLEDVEAKILSNFASIFIFRTQNKASIDLLAKNYQLSESELIKIQNLNQGGCLVIQIYKDKSSSSFFISKIPEISIPRSFKILLGNNMIEISESDIRKLLGKMNYDPSKLIHQIANEEEISMVKLISLLFNIGLNDNEILYFLRGVGINDIYIADAFAAIKTIDYND
ncbi:MAG: ATP-binding protein [Candidatus Micrarchaeia archaeon]